MKSNTQSTKLRQERMTVPFGGGKNILRSILIGGVALLLSGALTLIIGAFIAYRNEDPTALELPLSLAALYISFLVGGAVSARLSPMGALLGGLCFSAIFTSLVCFMGMLMAGKGGIENSGLYLAICAAMPIIGAMISAFLESKKSASPKKRSSRNKKRIN